MKMADAVTIMDAPKPQGFMVTFEHVEGGLLQSDTFPEVHAGEPPIPDEDTAWRLAARFAQATYGKCVNIYVIRREDFAPVPHYREFLIRNR
jgi:hypothetical protein